jgi:hypothetical protein
MFTETVTCQHTLSLSCGIRVDTVNCAGSTRQQAQLQELSSLSVPSSATTLGGKFAHVSGWPWQGLTSLMASLPLMNSPLLRHSESSV